MNSNPINWKVRFRNKVWLTSFVSQTLLLVQAVLFGLEGLHAIDLNMESVDSITRWIVGIIDAALAYLSYLGIVQDPTVAGIGDSKQVLNREEPAPQDQNTFLPK